jgi:hypothetical protein
MVSLISPRRRLLLPLAALCLLVIFLVPFTQSTSAQSSGASASVALQYFTVQVQYPSVVSPGSTIQVFTLAVAKSSVDLNSLTAYVYYTDGSSLHQVTSATLVGSQNVATGNQFTNNIPVTVPQGMPRTSLFATFTESVRLSYVSSYADSSYYNGNSYDCGYYNYYDGNNCSYYPYYSAYPQYSYISSSDTGISPLSYVNATTPEYSALLSQYRNQQQQLSQVQSQNQKLQQQVSQQNQQIAKLQSQIQQLQQTQENQQNALTQKDSTNSNLNSELSAMSTMNRNLIYLVLGIGVVAILVSVLGSRSGRPKKTQSVNPYASNYAPAKPEKTNKQPNQTSNPKEERAT